jgi:MFS family permease
MSPRGGDLLRHRDFQKLWAGQTVSLLGSQVSQLALPLVAVLVLHVSAFYVALLGTVDMLPFLLFALPAGVWIDRIRRRPVLIVADTGRALALATVPIVAAFGELTIWQLYAVGFVTGTFTVFFDVAYQSYLPSLVGRPHLVEGNAKLELSRSAAQIAGPGLGGVLVGAITAPYAIVVDSVSFAVSALFLGRIRKREPRPEPTATPSMRGELMEGLRYVLGDPRWRAITLYVSTFNFFSSVAFALYVVYAVRNLGLTPGELGLVFALGNLGWLFGAVVVRRLSGRLGIGWTLVFAAFIGGAATLLIPLAPVRYAIPFLVTSGVLTALGIVLYNVTAISLIQTLTPDRLLGRANASRRWIVWGTIPLGSLVGGVLSTAIGVRGTLFVGTIGASLCFLFLLARPLRSIHDLPEQEGEPVPLVDDVALGLEGQSAEA